MKNDIPHKTNLKEIFQKKYLQSKNRVARIKASWYQFFNFPFKNGSSTPKTIELIEKISLYLYNSYAQTSINTYVIRITLYNSYFEIFSYELYREIQGGAN